LIGYAGEPRDVRHHCSFKRSRPLGGHLGQLSAVECPLCDGAIRLG
jgi:hypothetical protein